MTKKIFLLLCLICLYACGAIGVQPKTFVRTADDSGNWRNIEFGDQVKGKQDEVWRLAVDTLASKYDIEVLEKESGYLRSSWKFSVYVREQGGIYRYRSRIVVKFDTAQWSKLQVKCESQWLSNYGWLIGYDTAILEEIYGDLQGKLARTVR